MKITLVCRTQLYDRIISPLRDEPGMEFSPALHRWQDFMEWVQKGTDAIILEEGIAFSDAILSMPFPSFTFSGNRDYAEKVLLWVQSLDVRLKKVERVEEVSESEDKQEHMVDDLFFVAQREPQVKIGIEPETVEEQQKDSHNEDSVSKSETPSIPFIPRKPKNSYFKKIYQEPQEQQEQFEKAEIISMSSTAEGERSAPSVQPSPIRRDDTVVQQKPLETRRVSTEESKIPYDPPTYHHTSTSSSVQTPETITVFSGKGGVGVDTLSLHIAGLYAKTGIKVSVIDLALPFGHISTYLNVAPSPYASDIVQEGSPFYISESEVKRMTVEQGNIRYYLPPNQWPTGFHYDQSMLDKIIRNMQRLAPITICNLNHHHDWKAQSMVFSCSTKIIWVLDMNKATIFHTKRHLVTLREMGFDSQDKIHFIINRIANYDIDPRLIEETLEGRVILQLPEDKEVSSAMNDHMILTHTNKLTPFTTEMNEWFGISKANSKGKISKILGR